MISKRFLLMLTAVVAALTGVDYLFTHFLSDRSVTWAMPSRPLALPAKSLESVASTTAFTTYLPAVNKYNMPDYVYPFSVVMYHDVDDATGLAKMKDAGSRWVTTFLYWSDVEPAPPVGGVHTYDWAKYDAKFGNARAAGMQVFVVFVNSPGWVRESPPDGVVPPEHLPDLVNISAAMAERYDGDGVQDAPGSMVVNDWSFYAEPDAQQYWGYNGAAFAQMIAAVSDVIHEANPNARVLIGGIGFDWFTDDEYHNPPGPFVRRFITDTLTALNTYPGGAANYIDAFDFHYYPVTLARWPTLREKALAIKQIMSNHGLGDLPLLVSEMGYWSAESTGSNQTRQAQYLVHFYVRGLSVGLEQLSWWTVFDQDRPTWTDGLFEGQDLSRPKPSYYAYQMLTSELGYARFASVLNVPGAEGYQFTMATGQTKAVVWGTNPIPTQVSFAQSCARRVEMLGNSTQIVDGGSGDLDGIVNGQIRLQVSQDQPIYVGACS